MPNQMQLKGATPSKQTRYAPLWTGRFFSGVVTQRSPLRGNITRLEEAYFGSRGDEILSGLNTEISPKLTLIRRPGLSVYNSSSLPAVNRFYEFRTLVNNTESIKVLADCAPQSPATVGTVRDVTGPSNNTTLWSKTGVPSVSGKTSFQSVGDTLYASDQTTTHKWLLGPTAWTASTNIAPGSLAVDGSNNVQMALGGITLNIVAFEVPVHVGVGLAPIVLYVNPLAIPDQFANLEGATVTFSGLTTATYLNGNSYPVAAVLSSTIGAFIVDITYPGSHAKTAETGSVTTGSGTTGLVAPSFSGTEFAVVADSGQQWKCYGPAIQNWGLQAPALAPTFPSSEGLGIASRCWIPNFTLPNLWYAILDKNQNVQVAIGTLGIMKTGATYPTFSQVLFSNVSENGVITWDCLGPVGAWVASTTWADGFPQVILDSNGNWQWNQGGNGTTGATQPTWATLVGAGTTDGTLSWMCLGPGIVIASASEEYAFSTHGIDGSVSTASPIATIQGPIVGAAPLLTTKPWLFSLQGSYVYDSQIDQIWIWRTTQGGSTLFLEDRIPADGLAGNFVYYEYGIPDSPASGLGSLNVLIEAPIDDTNDPPPLGLQALAYHLQRIWGAIGNLVYYSDGPDVISGNGNTAWSPGNVFAYPETVIRLFPTSSGLLVFTLSDVYIIQGLGTSASPLTSLPLLQDVGLSSYDAFDVNGSIVYMYTSDNQIVSLDPSSGVSEIGFAIGDQFGPGNGTNTFTPTSTHLTWHIAGSKDKGLYVSDFAGNWWRMSPTPSPETGIAWSPMASFIPSIGGFSAVQSVETSPGTHLLLVGPATGTLGPILKRDYSVLSDNGVAYSANAVFGSLVLAQPGQIALVESLTTDAVKIGSPLSLAVQLDEIAPLSSGYFEGLVSFAPDPTQLPPSLSVYAQRFYLSQTQQPAECRHLQVEVNFGSDTAPNELLSMTLFGGFEQEK